MKLPIKNLLKLLFLLVITITIVRCEKSENLVDTQESKINTKAYEKITIEQIPKIKELLDNLPNSSFNKYGTSQVSRTSNYLELLNLEEIISIADSQGNESYTLDIENYTDNIEKLHIVKFQEGYIISVQEYIPDSNWLNNQEGGIDYSTFTGVINNYSLDDSLLWSLNLDNGVIVESNDYLGGVTSRSGSSCECAFSIYWEDAEGQTYEDNPVDGDNYGSAGVFMVLDISCPSDCGGGSGGGGYYNGGSTGGGDTSGSTGTIGGGGGSTGGTSGTYVGNTNLNGQNTTCNGCNPGTPLFTKPFMGFISGLSQEQQDFLNLIENFQLKLDLQNYFNVNGFSIESETIADDIIEAGLDGSLITPFPFVKYPDALAAQYKATYPKLTEYLQNELPKLADDTDLVNALMQFGSLTQEQIRKKLEWGNGPEIKFKPLSAIHTIVGRFNGLPANHPDGNGEGPNVIELNTYTFNEIEQQLQNGGEFNSGTLNFFFAVVILHEMTHYGDFHYNGNMFGPNSEVETGGLFETEIFGTTIDYPEDLGIVQEYLIKKQD